MSMRLLLAIFLLSTLPMGVGVAEDQEPSAARWGITTKKNLEGLNTPASDENADTPMPNEAQPPATKSVKTEVMDSENGDQHPKAPSPAPIRQGDRASSPKSGDPTARRPPEGGITPSHNGQQKGKTRIAWASEMQEEACSIYLADLRRLFLEARHFSIQGAACETAASSAKFLDLEAKCQRECPENFLEQSGYSNRIIRNIRYLEKLGNDRCSGTLNGSQSE